MNLAGSFLLGGVVGYLAARSVDPALRNGVTVGLLGGFTTFSTYALQSVELWEAGRPQWATLNVFVSTIAGLALAALGLAVGRALS